MWKYQCYWGKETKAQQSLRIWLSARLLCAEFQVIRQQEGVESDLQVIRGTLLTALSLHAEQVPLKKCHSLTHLAQNETCIFQLSHD